MHSLAFSTIFTPSLTRRCEVVNRYNRLYLVRQTLTTVSDSVTCVVIRRIFLDRFAGGFEGLGYMFGELPNY